MVAVLDLGLALTYFMWRGVVFGLRIVSNIVRLF